MGRGASSATKVIGVSPVMMGVPTYADQLGLEVLQFAVQWRASTVPLPLSQYARIGLPELSSAVAVKTLPVAAGLVVNPATALRETCACVVCWPSLAATSTLKVPARSGMNEASINVGVVTDAVDPAGAWTSDQLYESVGRKPQPAG